MAILIFEVSFHRFRVSPVEFSSMAADALLAPKLQPVLVGTILAKLTFVFPFFSLHFLHFFISAFSIARNSMGFWSKKQI